MVTRRGRFLRVGVIVAVAAVTVALFVVLSRVHPRQWEETVLRRGREVTGLQLDAGAASPRLTWHGIGVRVKHVAAACPDSSWGVEVQSLDIGLRLLPLLGRQPRLRDITLRRPRAWLFRKPRGKTTGAEALERSCKAGYLLAFFAAPSWTVRDGRFGWVTGGGEGEVNGLRARGKTRRERDGSFRGSLRAEGTGGSWRAGDRSYDLDSFSITGRFAGNGAQDSLRFDRVHLVASPCPATLGGELEISARGNGPVGGNGIGPAALQAEGSIHIRDGAFPRLAVLQAVARAFSMREGLGGRWPFQELDAHVSLRNGTVVLDTARVAQPGLTWSLAGTATLQGNLKLEGTLRADPTKVTLPARLRFLAETVVEADGRVPLDFHVRGNVNRPQVSPAWNRLAARAAAAIQRRQAETLRR